MYACVMSGCLHDLRTQLLLMKQRQGSQKESYSIFMYKTYETVDIIDKNRNQFHPFKNSNKMTKLVLHVYCCEITKQNS